MASKTTAPAHTFKQPGQWFKGIDAGTSATLAQTGSDIALIISPVGTIEDLAYRDPELLPYVNDNWVGKRWETTVTSECVGKIQGLLAESDTEPATRRRQVNHPAPGHTDLPVDYAVVALPGFRSKIALGNDLRKIADVQSRLVQAQLEMEHEYRQLRRAETRYRILFQLLTEPITIVDGASLKIIDINLAATKLLHRTAIKASGESVTSLFAKESRDEVAAAITFARKQSASRSMDAVLMADNQHVLLSIEPFRDDGHINLILKFEPPRKTTLEPIAEQAWDAESLLRDLPEALVVTDTAGLIIEANDQFVNFVHSLDRDNVTGRNLENWLGASPVDMQVLLANLRDKEQTRNFSSVLRDEYGGSRQVQVSAKRLSQHPDSKFCFLISEAPSSESAIASRGGKLPGETSEMAELVGRVPLKDMVREASEIIERMCIESALRQTRNNRASAADMLGLSRQSLYVKLKRHGLEQFALDD